MSLRKPRLEPRTLMRPAPLASALAGLAAVAVLGGCQPEPNSGRGFTLPVGNVDAGKSAFLTLECQACHIVKEIEQLSVADGKPRMSIPLGGEVTRIQTYGELVTSIINPSHRLARAVPGADQTAGPGKSDSPVSPMTNYNQVMTVQQLIDLTTFLQSLYRIRPYEPTEYPIFPM
jgi:sulfur-oxidizing protein SoxX